MINFYEVLKIDKDASKKDIQRAYYEKALKFHPDKNQDNKAEALTNFQLVCRAYKVLHDSSQRESYDKFMSNLHKQGINQNESSATCGQFFQNSNYHQYTYHSQNSNKGFSAQYSSCHINFPSFHEKQTKSNVFLSATSSFSSARTNLSMDAAGCKLNGRINPIFSAFFPRREESRGESNNNTEYEKYDRNDLEGEESEAEEEVESEEAEEEEGYMNVNYPSSINSYLMKNSVSCEKIRKTLEELLWKKKTYDEEKEKKKYFEKIKQKQQKLNKTLFLSKKIKKYKTRTEKQGECIIQNLRRGLPVFRILNKKQN